MYLSLILRHGFAVLCRAVFHVWWRQNRAPLGARASLYSGSSAEAEAEAVVSCLGPKLD